MIGNLFFNALLKDPLRPLLVLLIAMLNMVSVGHTTAQKSKVEYLDAAPALAWAHLTLEIMKTTPNGSPTYGSRFVGYTGLVMYQTTVFGGKYESLVGKLNGLENLTEPKKNQKINWILAMNAGQASILKALYGFTSSENLQKIDSLEASIVQRFSANTDEKVIKESIEFGKKVAQDIFEWSKTDGGFEAYKYNFDTTFVASQQPGIWSPPARGQADVPLPLHPTWGRNRTFAPANYTLPIPAMVEYNYRKNSEYRTYMEEVYQVRKNLTQEQKEIANWWGDDPSETFSPPGHSYYTAAIAIKKSNVDLFDASRAFAAVGMAVADAFINCWKTKYHYNVERPFAFIFYNIDTMWELYWPEPPFPAFYSGHAGQAASAATVLTKIFGENFEFTDDSHFGRPMDRERMVEYKIRNFKSFFEAAEESAMSRLYGGIHTRLDNEVGLVEGKKIGENINQLFF